MTNCGWVFPTSNGALLIFMELSFYKTKYKTGFTNSRFSKKHQFKLTDFALCGTVRPLSSSSSCCSSLGSTIRHDSVETEAAKENKTLGTSLGTHMQVRRNP